MFALRLIPRFTVVRLVLLALSTARSISRSLRVQCARFVRSVRLVLLPAVSGCSFQAHDRGIQHSILTDTRGNRRLV